MRALVTGADGFVGRYLVDLLTSAGDDVTESTVDITDRDNLIDAFAEAAPNVVYHLAAQADVGGSWDAPIETYRVNVEGTANVLDSARLAGARRVLAITSADIYGHVHEGDLPLTETQPLRPVSPYAASKAAAEMVCIQAGFGHGLEVIRVRAFNHLGPGQGDRFAASAIASRIAHNELSGETSVRVGNLEARRDYTDVRDVVRAYRMLMVDGQPGETYHVCSGVDRPISELADTLILLASIPMHLAPDPSLLRPADVPVLRGDNGKLREATGWVPQIPIEQTLENLLQHWRQIASAPTQSH